MDKNNAPTATVLRVVTEKMKEEFLAGNETPYHQMRDQRIERHPGGEPGEWPEEDAEAAVEALGVWASVQIVGMIRCVLGEIEDATESCVNEKAAAELKSSMGFISEVFKTWAMELDMKQIAESIFEMGVQFEKGELKPSNSAAKKKKAADIIDELLKKHTRPSLN